MLDNANACRVGLLASVKVMQLRAYREMHQSQKTMRKGELQRVVKWAGSILREWGNDSCMLVVDEVGYLRLGFCLKLLVMLLVTLLGCWSWHGGCYNLVLGVGVFTSIVLTAACVDVGVACWTQQSVLTA